MERKGIEEVSLKKNVQFTITLRLGNHHTMVTSIH